MRSEIGDSQSDQGADRIPLKSFCCFCLLNSTTLDCVESLVHSVSVRVGGASFQGLFETSSSLLASKHLSERRVAVRADSIRASEIMS